MIYFLKNGDIIEKYQIYFDIEALKELNTRIIDNCSLIIHREERSDYPPIFWDQRFIKNLKSIPVGEKEYYEEVRTVYQYTYDEYLQPCLSLLIDKLLANDSCAIDEIINYNTSPDTLSIDDMINLISQEFIEIDPDDIEKRKEKLKELENLLEERKLNQNRKSTDTYYNELLKLIGLDFISSISISELNNVEFFLEIKLEDKIKISNLEKKAFTRVLNKLS